MKLKKIDLDLDWPVSIGIMNLRKYVMQELMKEGEVIRWSILDIQDSVESNDTKRLKIQAVLADLNSI